MSKNTTVWGVVIAGGLVTAVVALNSPGGSTSLAGRALSSALAKVFPTQPAARPRAVPVPPQRPGEPPVWPATADLRRSAVMARQNMAHAPAEIDFRDVRATIVPGRFNGDQPGTPFLGFCGEMHVPPNVGWGRTGWKPFYVSETRSSERGNTMYLNVADLQGIEKCKGPRSPVEVTDIFLDGPVETPIDPGSGN
jgi:hypothetical protein